ncbi:TIR domain-containing protein [Polaribacter cellanae]|uniref:TIR domain-containing protein n=1 Tax=Polaribacter cellanae TaxID=2818493 RepID=A0A975CNP3_9FLAO|nr:TIR domain-containing protein [Polaribacter cellanae]QTE23286.1 TIR domain-containing protein [Polaribacter cellanae]
MKHKVFISYHHEKDLLYRQRFEELFSNQFDILDSYAVKQNEIGNVGTEEFRRIIREKHLRESTVTIVLIGEATWSRKHVDYEIYNTLKVTSNNSRSGLLRIILPSYDSYQSRTYNSRTIPKRLSQNIQNRYTNIHFWSENPIDNQNWIHDAFLKRNKILPNNTMPIMKNNWKGNFW